MKIDAYGTSLPKITPPARPKSDPAVEPTAQEKLRRLLDEKRHIAESVFQEQTPESELGQHIDLRV
jgi:hypothetical protein